MTKILKLPEVMNRTALSRSSIYAMAAKGLFPAPLKLSVKAVGWNEAELNAWLEQRPVARNR